MDNIDNMMNGLDDARVPKPEAPTPAPTQTAIQHSTYTPSGNSEKFDPWQDFDELEPKAIDVSALKRFTRNVTVASFGDVPSTIEAKLDAILPLLQEKGFTLRLGGDKRDKLETMITPKYASKEYHIPYKKFNPDVTPETFRPTKYAYQIAKGIHKGMPKLSNPIRGIIAANTHALLGKNCDDATKIVLVYSSDGAETKKTIEYKTTGKVSYFIEVGEIIGSAVFNLVKEDCVERLTQYLNTIQN